MKDVFQKAMAKMTDRADSLRSTSPTRPKSRLFTVPRSGRSDARRVVDRFYGAPTKAFPKQFDEAQLQQAFVSRCTAKCMRAIWDRRSILLCVQNDKTQSNGEAMQGVKAFKDDPKYANGTEIIMLNPADKAERAFLRTLRSIRGPPRPSLSW